MMNEQEKRTNAPEAASHIPTPHISAKYGDFAKTVLMPGDPLRSKFIAEHFLKDPVLVNNVRGVNGYTGSYKGHPVSVMASGMGQPSIGIYSYELYHYYGVENIIRVGSCGSLDGDLRLRDIVLAQGACTNSSYANQFNLPGTFCPIADFGLLERAAGLCRGQGIRFKVGNVLSSDMFYDDAGSGLAWAKMGVLAVEMESAALYANAARAGKKALTVCTVSDSLVNPKEYTTSEERETSFLTMIEIALQLALPQEREENA